jgi:polyphosphate kinase 2 (PPK2 family)
MPRRFSPKVRRKRIAALLEPFRVTSGKGFRLSRMDPADTRGVKSKEEAQEYLTRGIELLCEKQDKLYAQDEWGVLLVFQAMDAAGKDGAIKHVMSGINPQGCEEVLVVRVHPEILDKLLAARGALGAVEKEPAL